METEAVTLPLIGNQRLIKLGTRFDYQTGSLELPSTVINFLRTENNLFFLPLEIDRTSLPKSPPVSNSHSVSPEAVAVGPALPVSPSLSPSPVVLANGHLPARLKAAKQRKHQRGNRTQSHVVQAHLGESAVSPSVFSSYDSFPASAQQPQSFSSQDPPPISMKATVDELIRAYHECLEGDLTPEVMTDHGHEFQGDWYEWLAEWEATNPLTPVGSHHSLGKTERSHREWLTILWGILRYRGLDDSHWKEFASLATAKYNRQPRGSSHKSPFERRWGAQPPSPPIDTLRDLLQTSRPPSAETSPFPIGSSVLYHHPDHPYAKLAPLYTPATVLQRISEHVFRLRLPSGRPILSHRRCIRPNDSPNPDPVYVVPLPLDSPLERADTSVGSSQQQEQQQQQSSDSPYLSAPHENTGRCFLGSVRAVDPEGEGQVEVQAWGSNGKQPLASRRMQPA
eukprot:Cvel_4580.t1-p1 / transcript=Cvel_4580.t1 / gene=Cvel_4580 / organism=Chromera_velia_CCMP2878 / gene_product=hypothetical protein / transcript_product=hypothetical protein / location=Cvel_scaffold201:64055-65761(-) / protein_length=452 / sequence_SO=supercontig / SO=protein_coding / is_pseudo=false